MQIADNLHIWLGGNLSSAARNRNEPQQQQQLNYCETWSLRIIDNSLDNLNESWLVPRRGTHTACGMRRAACGRHTPLALPAGNGGKRLKELAENGWKQRQAIKLVAVKWPCRAIAARRARHCQLFCHNCFFIAFESKSWVITTRARARATTID